MVAGDSGGVKPSPSARRATELLTFLAGDTTRAYSISELSRALELNRATCQSVLMALDKSGFVRRDPRTKAYTLGPALIPIGQAALSSFNVVDEARSEVDALAAATGAESVASVASDTELIIVARAGPPGLFGAEIRVGRTVPLCPPFGIAFVAWAGPETVDAWLARAGLLPAALRQRYLDSIDAVRQRGYSITLQIRSRERLAKTLAQLESSRRHGEAKPEHEMVSQVLHEEYLFPQGEAPGPHPLSQISAPVFGPDRKVAAVIGVSGFPHDLTGEEITSYATPVLAAAERITARLHGVHP